MAFCWIFRITITNEGTARIGFDHASTVFTIEANGDGSYCNTLFVVDDETFEEDETVVFALELIGDPDVDILTSKITFIIVNNDGNQLILR